MFDLKKVYLGITPTGWTNDDLPTIGEDIPFEQCVSEMALAGFQGCSIGHKFPTEAAQLREELKIRNLRISEPWASTYFTVEPNGEQTRANFQERMDFIQEVYEGSDVSIKADMVVAELGCAVHQQPLEPLINRPRFTDEQWEKMVLGLKELAKKADDNGMKLCYHHHVGTGVQQSEEIDRLMQYTEGSSVHLLFDTGHLYYAEELTQPGTGQQKIEYIVGRYADRIKHVHLKNIRLSVLRKAKAYKWSFLKAMQEGVFTVPGDHEAGAIDFEPVLKALADKNYEGWLIVEAEQDPHKANPLRYAQMAHQYLEQKVKSLSAEASLAGMR